MRRWKILGLAGMVVAMMLTAATPAAADARSDLVRMMNEARADAGLPPLAEYWDLSDDAMAHSSEMAAADDVYHNPDLASVTSGWEALAENVGFGYSLEALFDTFMGSPGHRANILGDYDYVGTGVVSQTPERHFVTIIFMKGAGGVAGSPPQEQGFNEGTGIYEMVFPHLDGIATYSDTWGACRGTNCSRTHEGTDLMAPKMTPIVAVADGIVSWMHAEQGGNCCALGLSHDDGWASWYIHMNNDTPGTDDGQGWGFAEGISVGTHVVAGQLIGWVGDSGNAENSGAHTHFELHMPGGQKVNPYPHLVEATIISSPVVPGEVDGCDFDGDGYHDLLVGVPGEDVGEIEDAGAVSVFYGSEIGLDAYRNTMWSETSTGVFGSAEPGDGFGAATACGDLNGDGYADAVIGLPGEDVGDGGDGGGAVDAGGVQLLWGSAQGLVPIGDGLWTAARAGVPGAAEAGDGFGSALAVGDFDGDGYDDIAIGAPGEAIVDRIGAGGVTVLYGSATGIDVVKARTFNQSSAGMAGTAEADDAFGAALATGDFDGDGFDDLAIGVPGEDIGAIPDAGAVQIVYGSEAGLGTRDRVIHQDSTGVRGAAEAGDQFGFAVVVGDTNGDGRDDLAVGVPFEDVGDLLDAGTVQVFLGSATGVTATGDRLFHQDSYGVRGKAETGDRFGAALAFGDFNGDRREDLVIGVPDEQVGSVAAAGGVAVLPGGDAGTTAAGDLVMSQATAGVAGAAEAGDRFGAWLVTGAFDGDLRSSLVVGVPFEDVGEKVDEGTIQVFGSGPGGLLVAEDRIWSQSSDGVAGAGEPGDGFGVLGG